MEESLANERIATTTMVSIDKTAWSQVKTNSAYSKAFMKKCWLVHHNLTN
jgi:hypothetical protein